MSLDLENHNKETRKKSYCFRDELNSEATDRLFLSSSLTFLYLFNLKIQMKSLRSRSFHSL